MGASRTPLTNDLSASPFLSRSCPHCLSVMQDKGKGCSMRKRQRKEYNVQRGDQGPCSGEKTMGKACRGGSKRVPETQVRRGLHGQHPDNDRVKKNQTFRRSSYLQSVVCFVFPLL